MLGAVRQLLEDPAIQDLQAQQRTTDVTMRGLLERMDSAEPGSAGEDADMSGDRELAGFIMGRFASQQMVGDAAWLRRRRDGKKEGGAAAARFRSSVQAMDRMVMAGRLFRSAKRRDSGAAEMSRASGWEMERRRSLQPPGAGAGAGTPLSQIALMAAQAKEAQSGASGSDAAAGSGPADASKHSDPAHEAVGLASADDPAATAAANFGSESKAAARLADVRVGRALSHAQQRRVKAIVESVGAWDLDAIELDDLLDGGALSLLGDIVLRRNGFLDGGQPMGEAMALAAIVEAGGEEAGVAAAGDRMIENRTGGVPLKHLGSRGSMHDRIETRNSRMSGLSDDDPILLVNAEKIGPFFAGLGEGYINTNPYHNRTHAADVMYTTHCLLQEGTLVGLLSQTRRLALLIGAALHDFKHPGYTNKLEIALTTDLAIQYNDRSVYENMHLAESFRLMRDNDRALDPLDTLDPVEYSAVRGHIVSAVLATDMQEHFATVASFEGKVVSVLHEHKRRGSRQVGDASARGSP